MIIRLIIFFAFIKAGICFGQNFCDSKTLADNEKKFLKADKKNKADTYEFADLAFNIAGCYRQKNDSVSQTWFRRTTISGKSAFKGCDRYHNTEVNRMIGQVGISEYYLGHYKEAIRFLEKTIASGKNPDHNYFLGLCYMQLENYDIALIELNNFKKASTDLKDVDDLIKTCEDKKGNK